MVGTRILDGENLRGELEELDNRLRLLGLGTLIKTERTLISIIDRYEKPDLRDVLHLGIKEDSPDYQSVKPFLERTLDKIYQEIDRREEEYFKR